MKRAGQKITRLGWRPWPSSWPSRPSTMHTCKRDLWYHILNTQILVYQRDCDLNWNSLRESYHSEREQQAFFRPNFGFCPKQSSPPFGTHNLQDVIAKVTCLDSFTEEYFLLPKNDPSPLPKKTIDRLNSNTFWIILIHLPPMFQEKATRNCFFLLQRKAFSCNVFCQHKETDAQSNM